MFQIEQLDGDLRRGSSFFPAGVTESHNHEFDAQIQLMDENGEILNELPYTIIVKNGDFFQGITDSNGMTGKICTENSVDYELYFGHVTKKEVLGE